MSDKSGSKQQPEQTETTAEPGHQPSAGHEKQLAELTEALQRERADAVNLRRRHEEDIAGIKVRLKANVVRDMLPVIDNFERAFKHYPLEGKELDSSDKLHEWVKGIMQVKTQFDKTLSDIGVERIATVGQPFDPRYHEAVAMEDGDGSQEIVSEELQAGYRIGEDVIRHAMVRVKLQ